MGALVLSEAERSLRERETRRSQAPRALAERCRIVLRCADGLTNKAVAAEPGVYEHTVGK